MDRLHGHQQMRENRWTGGPTGNFTASPSSPAYKKEATLVGRSPPNSMTASPWSSNFGLQTTTEPRPVFSPNTSYSYRPSALQRQPSHSDFYIPQSNSDFLMGSLNQRDQYAMDTPLNTPLDTPLPPPPPLLSGGRLGAITILYVLLRASGSGWLQLTVYSMLGGLLFSVMDTTIVSTALVSIATDLSDFQNMYWVVLAYMLSYLGQ